MFEELKKNLQKKIEEDAVKSNLQGEIVYLKKGSALSFLPIVGNWFREWGQIHPVIMENGNINWINFFFGGWKNFIKLLIILGLVGMALLGYYQVFHSYEVFRNQPCVQTCIELAKDSHIVNRIPFP